MNIIREPSKNILAITPPEHVDLPTITDILSSKLALFDGSRWRQNFSCTIRESNPGQVLGRHLCYHYTNGAVVLHASTSDFKFLILCLSDRTRMIIIIYSSFHSCRTFCRRIQTTSANSFRTMGDQHNGCMSRVCRLETWKRYIALFIRTPRSACGNIPLSRHSQSCHWILTLPLCRDHVTHRSGKRFKINTFVLLLTIDTIASYTRLNQVIHS